ncbi:integral membrane protein DUF106-domain-containing protein [Melampsora americana]|nr:integral membrane protein DUF106-domain-containing protein [Melampsora americana]
MSRWSEQDIRLDPAIRNWVLLPITLVMLLVGILRHYAMQLLHTDPKPISLKSLREQRILLRSNYFRSNGHFLNPTRFENRRQVLIQALESGAYLSDHEVSKPTGKEDVPALPPNPLESANMEGMMDGMKKQMVMMIPQTVIMGWINAFFFGFVCVKLPFPLPNGFKQMLQRGIETPDMHISWVSSLSWYFLNLFGLNSLYRLILGDGNAADGSNSLAMGGAGATPVMVMPGQQVDYKKLFKAEVENLKLVDHKHIYDQNSNLKLDSIEDRVLRMYGKKS